MTTKITTDNIATATLSSLGGGIKITTVAISSGLSIGNPAGAETITLTGTGFNAGILAYLNNIPAVSTTYISPTSLSFVTPVTATDAYSIILYNTNGSTGVKPAALGFSNPPVWTTASGALTVALVGIAYSVTVLATGDTIVYSIASGSLPAGLSLNSSSGVIAGTATTVLSSSFTVRATNTFGQYVDRAFTIATISIVSATGGTITTVAGYRYHTFTASSNFVVSSLPAGTNTMEYWVQAGGGSGGRAPNVSGSGGGAGGGLDGSATITATSYTITIGAGGAAYISPLDGGSNTGSDSSIVGTSVSVVSKGGGGGSFYNGNQGYVSGKNGGCGAGAGWDTVNTVGKGVYPGSTYLNQARQGYDGGSGNLYGAAGGGGGTAAVGGSGSGNTQGGNGGAGTNWKTLGTYYGGGGGGGGDTVAGAAGTGGGGAGGRVASIPGIDAGTNTGGGGGGTASAAYNTVGTRPSGAGGSGIVIIRYLYG